jgi:hypothetical protein
MDPLSIIASSIAVATLAASTCEAFSNLRALCKSFPGRLHALNNEVADIEIVLIQVAKVVEERISEVVEQRISQVGDMIIAQSEQYRANQTNQSGPFYRAPPVAYRTRASRKASMNSDRAKGAPSRSEGVGVRVSQYPSSCRPGCPCACHSQRRSNTPTFMNRVLGQMFVGYVGLPLLSPKCDNAACEKSQVPTVSVEYWFPLGFCWSQIVRLQVGYRPNVGPQFNLTTLRSVPDTAQCVDYALNGNIEGLKDLFKRGLASPWDVSNTRGYTMVRVGLPLVLRSNKHLDSMLSTHLVGLIWESIPDR